MVFIILTSPDCRCINISSNSLYDEAKKIIHFQMVVGINHVQHRYIMKTSDILSDEKHCPKERCQVNI